MYIELHCHSAFSFLDGASLPEQLALTASQLGYPALALTDHNGLYGSLAFAHEAKQLGLQAITGAELTLRDGSHVTLLAETPDGYANLCRLITEAHLGSADRRDPRLDFASLEARHAGLIVLSGCRTGLLPGVLRRDGPAAARRLAERCRAVFGRENFVVELQRNYVRGDLALTRALKDVADSVRLSVVATGNVHYHKRERHRLHDVLVAIRHRTTLDGSHNVRHANSEFFLRQPAGARQPAPRPRARLVGVVDRVLSARPVAHRSDRERAVPGTVLERHPRLGAGHRSRFPARDPRGADPAGLQAVRRRARRAGVLVSHLPPALDGARNRQGAGPAAGRD